MFTIAVDVMGGDLGPRVAFKACKKILRSHSDLHLIITLTADVLTEAEQYFSRHQSRVELIICDSFIAMSDQPARVLRHGKSSTMATALKQVKEQNAQGIISVGNTGALMVLSRSILGTMQGVSRPALATQLPTGGKPLLMLDLGANLSSSADQLCEFARLGAAWCKTRGERSPKVGLLNIGQEESKGTEEVQQAGQLLSDTMGQYYVGFREGDSIYSGDLDVLACDGFSGNVALKTSEGLAGWVSKELSRVFDQSPAAWLLRPIWRQLLKRVLKRFTSTRYAGALLLGVDGIVVKTHGKSDEIAFYAAMNYLLEQTRQVDLSQVKAELIRLAPKDSATAL
ncbi:phosphate acyltransferase PlsX [Bacterioplanoides sp.]|uniref:phosphate acyltransferase PlsX n=1 Tax=Bacterioplanoides sp. TaxID=2066072 RepID=UPI003B59F80C